jgi:hypothetical protein
MRRMMIVLGIAAAATMPAVAAQAGTTPPAPKTATVDVMVDSHLGDTTATIDCGAFGWHQSGPDGDGTLILANVGPGKIRCTITLRG